MKKPFFFVLIIFLDQITKLFARSDLLPFWRFFRQPPYCNPFVSWGIPLEGLWFWSIWILSITLLSFLAIKTKQNIFLIIILAGAFSNLIDRLRFSCVIDFIQLGNFPTFNLADVAITGGVILLLLFQGKIKKAATIGTKEHKTDLL